ncbi:MAG: DEAD/DEAH box helicase [Sulfuricurvum sp.]|uniref:DEAD/DEAH box helicase n=1 Tax=Sulfuricurvum sp. TaxID=2025608 RepID=UPI002737661E|nr:DEAD/DEAH box helicase [Sulfuricurvum sp.]MDP2850543.1 DEAD/DEAH box helicase [Sulfuricurvum sp.]
MTTVTELRNILRGQWWEKGQFEILRLLSSMCTKNSNEARELVIRALDSKSKLEANSQQILDEIAMQVGLYPYVDNLAQLSLRSAFNHAAHRAIGEMSDYVLHNSQNKIFEALLDGHSVILSAPTSYGKSLIIDTIIAAKNFSNVILIVPTIALIEETRRRMVRFSPDYQVITNVSQPLGYKNIFVLTQERYLAIKDSMPDPDFFVIDEFYKLSIGGDGSRASLLNHAFLLLFNTGAQFYLLGPSIQEIPDIVHAKLDCKFFVEDYHTVALELHHLVKKPSKEQVLAEALNQMQDQTLIYCKSPNSTRKLAEKLIELNVFTITQDEELLEAAQWTANNYHDQWLVTLALKHGVGIHHGRLPRALGRFMIRAFEEKKINVLLCTSTLIEGVNTSAKNVVIFDNLLDRRKLDFFTYNNIRGRSGRMFKHFIGHVYVFDKPPVAELPFVDIPAFNPTDTTPNSLLLQMDKQSLPDKLIKRLDKLLIDNILPLELLQVHSGIEPEYLIDTAKKLLLMNPREIAIFAWSGNPDYDELDATSYIIWNELNGAQSAKRAGLRSEKMMTFWINDLYKKRNVSKFQKIRINNLINGGAKPDDAVEDVLSFLRNWASFSYPKYLVALNDVVKVILAKKGIKACDYIPFAGAIEHLFQPQSFLALEEYGLPLELSEKLVKSKVIHREDDLGKVLNVLRKVSLKEYGGNVFESRMLEDFQQGLGK